MKSINLLVGTVNLSMAVQIEAHKPENPLHERITTLFDYLPEAFRAEGKENWVAYHNWLTSQYFVTLIAQAEGALLDSLLMCLRKYPQKIAKKELPLQIVLDANRKEEIIDRVINAHLNEVMYSKPGEYKAVICNILSMEATTLDPYWPIFVEAKARRDLGIHNDWRRNEIYDRKARDVGLTPDITATFLYADNDYFIRCSDAIVQMLEAILDHCRAKFGDEFTPPAA